MGSISFKPNTTQKRQAKYMAKSEIKDGKKKKLTHELYKKHRMYQCVTKQEI